MKNLWACFLLAVFLAGCGGGGGNPGTCSGSPQYCADAAGTGTGTPNPDAGGGSVVGVFAKSGTGDTVFDLPASVTRIRIQATYSANTPTTANFIVGIAGANVVNELLGASQTSTMFDGTYLLVAGGKVEITSSSGVSWTFSEIRPDTNPLPSAVFTKSGSGDTVFDLPTRVTRIRIEGTFAGRSSNFIVRIGGNNTVVNEVLGTANQRTGFVGTFAIAGGGTVEITRSSGVVWAFTEVP